jgi:hypothetical protein
MFAPERLIRLSLALILAATVAVTKTDPDLWGHVRFGIDMLSERSVRLHDTYSFTSDRPWVNHEWAAETTSAGAYLLGGDAGLITLKLVVMVSVLLLLNIMIRAEGVADPRKRDLILAAALITTIEQGHNVRPQLFSLLFFAGLLACLIYAERHRRILFAVPLIFAVWVNFHGGWVLGGGVLLLWVIGLAGSGERRAALDCAAAGAAALAATLLNPYGFDLLRFLSRTVGFGRADIVEWQPVYAVGWSAVLLWLAVAALAALAAVRRVRIRRDLPRVLVVIALSVAAFRVNRLLAFFALATLFLFGAALANAIPRRASNRPEERDRRAARYVAAAVALLLIAAASWTLVTNASCVSIDPRTTPPAGAVAFFKSQHSRGRLLVWFDWGEYAIWHLSPDWRVSIDGRRETVYSAELEDEHLRFYFDKPGGSELPRKLDANYVWIPANLPVNQRLRADGWTEAYRDDRSVIYSRTPVQAVASAPPSGALRRCFPGP